MQQQNSQSQNMLEMKSIFSLFDADNNSEIDIKQINSLLRELEILQYQEQKNIQEQQNNRPQSKEAVQVPINSQLPPMQPGRRITHSKKVNSSDNFEDQEKLNKTGQDSPQQSPTYIQVTELKYFPNNKTTMSFQDFCDIFNECMSNKDQHDELLQNAFSVFDFEKQGYIDSKKIKKVFEKFKDSTSEEEIQNVLKFCGVVNDKMTLNEFKEFFRKNL